MTPVISVRGIVNRFGHQLVHDGIDLDVMPGEVFGIVGGSGSGKSVLLRTMLGLQVPESGTVEIDGHQVTAASGRELLDVKRRYGVTFQQGALFTSLTVAQNVELPIAEYYLGETTLRELAELRIRMVGLPADAADKYPAQLSGGMVKRAALARALALDPVLLFLDEPTSGLDPISAAAFDHLVLYLQTSLKLTVVMITHDLDTIFRTCNRVGVIVDHRMISGTLDEIVRHEHPWIQEYFHGERSRAVQERR
jgi:phospholipid/cholesterol/gamma-HCH transport system ATP-binding protein